MRNRHSFATAVLVLAALATTSVPRTEAVELLISGNFETPGGVGDIPGWTLEEFLTGSAAAVNSADITGGTDVQLFLRAFEGGGPLRPAQANFDDDGLPAGDVDGADFLTWQRNLGLTGTALPSQGDATGDMNVDGSDLATWKSNFGKTPAFSNARLSQSVPATAGETYSFQGTSTFEDNYSGFVTTLGNESPHGAIPSPTTTSFRLEFLNAAGDVIGTPATRDLRTEQTFPGFPVVHAPLVALAPAGTARARVVAEALNMAWNGSTGTAGAAQSAFFNDFSLKTQTNPGTDILTNGDLNLGPPNALDFWNQVENPVTRTEILRTAGFANHTPAGSLGVWLSAFFGSHSLFEPNPVDGAISQTVEAQPGGTYTFSGWTRFEANYSGGVDTISAASTGMLAGMASPTDTEIKLEFLDINSLVIGSSVIDVKAARDALSPTSNPNDNLWYQHSLQAVAPAGTVFARLTAQMVDGVFNTDTGGGQSAFFDDFSLNGPGVSLVATGAVPEPSSLMGLAAGALTLGLARRRKR